jgi:autotransporter-associated beta strand protein
VAGALTVNKAILVVNADNQTRVYGEQNTTLNQTLTGFVNGETLATSGVSGSGLASTTATSASSIGNYTITADAAPYSASNYQFVTSNGVLTINPRPITVTADVGQTKVYGDINPTLTYSLEVNSTGRGLVGSDTFSGVLVRASGENVASNYQIGQGTLSNSNYAIEFVSANFSISQRPITLAATAVGKIYGNSDPTLSVTIASGSLGSTSVSDTLADVTGTISREVGNNVGTYAIALGVGTKANNYAITYTPALLTISKARLTATGSKVYNGEIEFEGANLTISGVSGESFAVTGNATMQTKNVQVAQRLANVNGLTITSNGNGVLTNYEELAVGDTQVTVTVKNITLTAPVLNKTYDGGYTYNMTSADLSAMSQNLVGGDRVASATVTFADSVVNGVTVANTGKNAGTGKSVTLSAVVISDGNDGANYNYTLANTTNNIISPASLTITAVNDAKFVTKTDAQGYANNCGTGVVCSGGYSGVIINGFVAGETTSHLTGSLSINRTNSGTESAGTYTGVLSPSGFTSSNYNITYVNGDYNIIAAQNLLVRVSPAATQYGSNPTYSITAQYVTSGSSTITSLTPIDNGVITVNDGVGGSANFVISASNPVYSSSGKLVVGGYALTPTARTLTGNNFLSMTLVGSLTVTPKELSVTQLGISGVTKVYDGGTNISGLTLNVNSAQSQVRSGDIVSISGTGTYADRNVGVNKNIDIYIGLTGADAANYSLSSSRIQSSSTGIYGSISQLASVDWVGPTTGGRWSNASNWTNGALPDGSNVGTVRIATGNTVIFDSALVGQVGSEIVNNGIISFNAANDFNFNSSVSGSGSLTQANAGILTVSGNNTFTGGISIGSSRLVLGSTNALGSGELTSSGGYLSTQSGVTLAGDLTVNGEVNLLTDINTVGNQTYNGRLLVANGTSTMIDILSVDNNKNIVVAGAESANVLSLRSTNGAIRFNNQVKASANDSTKKLSLEANALNGVFINQAIGGNVIDINSAGSYASNRFGVNGSYLYDFKVNTATGFGLATIAINADVITAGSQTYASPVTVGDNGTNGLTRSLISLDPAITFKSTVDDSAVGIHTLITKAIANDWSGSKPLVDYQDKVGGTKALAELVTVVGVRASLDGSGQVNVNTSETNRLGTVFIRDDVTTTGNQSYLADSAVVGRSGVTNQVIRFTANGGDVLFDLGSNAGSGVFGASNDVSTQFKLSGGALVGEDYFASSGIGVEMISNTNLNDMSYLDSLRKLAAGDRNASSYDEMIVGDVDIGNMEDAGDTAKCDVKNEDNCAIQM